MKPVSATTTIDAPREQVFALISDLALRGSFTDHFISSLHLQRLESSGVGASIRFRIDTGRKKLWMESVIDQLEPPHRLVERGRGGRSDRIDFVTAWSLVRASGGTEVTVSFWSDAKHPFDRLMPSVVGGARSAKPWRRALARLKQSAEAGEVPPRLEVAGGPRVAVRR